MEIIFYLILALFGAVMYLVGLSRPTPLTAFLFYATILGFSGLFFSSGIEIPTRGIDLSTPTQAIYLSNTYTYANNVFIKAAAWLCFAIGIYGFYQTLFKSIFGGVNAAGEFK